MVGENKFSPLKNARGTGEDDPDTSKKDIMDQGKRWAQAAGATVVSAGSDDGIEVSPLISYVCLPLRACNTLQILMISQGGEGLDKLKGQTITAPAVLEKELK